MTGYQSKRAAAHGKLDDDDTQVYQDHGVALQSIKHPPGLMDEMALTIAYQSGYYDGKKAAQPAQEPTKYSFKAHWEEDGCIGVVAAIERLDGGVHLLKDIIDAPQRPWVDLTDEEFDELEYRFARYELCRAIGAALRSKNT